jgi:hypothetical protein
VRTIIYQQRDENDDDNDKSFQLKSTSTTATATTTTTAATAKFLSPATSSHLAELAKQQIHYDDDVAVL